MATKKSKPPELNYPEGFLCGGIPTRTPATGDQKLGLLMTESPKAVVAAMTTKNRFGAPPIVLCRERLKSPGKLRGIVVNSGNANAATGAEGLKHAKAMARAVEKATGARRGPSLFPQRA